MISLCALLRMSTACALMLLPCSVQASADRSDPRREAEPVLAACIRGASAGWPWLEKTLWGLRDQERGWVGAQIRNRDGGYDLGPLQVNSWWVPRLARLTGKSSGNVRWWLIHDPCFNVHVARWIFLTALVQTRDYWRAVGVYHSPAAHRQRQYAQSVALRLQRRFGSDVFGQ